jgi:regulator of nucleoside diphosphate kinase
MQKTVTRAKARKPTLHISESDYDLIAAYAMGIRTKSLAMSDQVMEEIDRAVVHSDEDLPVDVVKLGAEVEFHDENSGVTRRVRLVMPSDSNVEEGYVSILTPIGAGLIGLRSGQIIDWPGRDGRARSIKVLDVVQKPLEHRRA